MKVPWLPFNFEAIAVHKWILYISEDPQLMLHEQVHLAQQKQYGFFLYMWRYFTDLNFRVRMEVEAYSVSHPKWSDLLMVKHIAQLYRVPEAMVAPIVAERRGR